MPGTTPVTGRYVLLRDAPEAYAKHTRKLLSSFKSYEVAAVLLPPRPEAPWDRAPVITQSSGSNCNPANVVIAQVKQCGGRPISRTPGGAIGYLSLF